MQISWKNIVVIPKRFVECKDFSAAVRLPAIQLLAVQAAAVVEIANAAGGQNLRHTCGMTERIGMEIHVYVLKRNIKPFV